MSFADLRDLDVDFKLQEARITGTGPGGPPSGPPRWSRRLAAGWRVTRPAGSPADAIIVPVVTADVDPVRRKC